MKNTLLILAFMIGAGTFANAQNKKMQMKMQEKAMEQVTELNEALTSQGEEFALTAEQMDKIKEIEYNKFIGTRKINKNESLSDDESKEQKKALRKASRKEVNDILTKEQRKAWRASKD
ncbi:hypothetical protein SAMN05192588_0657 [Nonlabens sp. Hel1_33_55]|uniref:hypothetical protein n=1 Tax=Nonlabens sp. Hel1_33_55 TaxID=1336802 RepID=UPI000875D186|nr:hypothetical protein [Nonlabens sp. Hel1_33_55]SCX99928.1 hypothetical protein SAMN05192588_0657 [Nonlabens sp. Hel1_33_55]